MWNFTSSGRQEREANTFILCAQLLNRVWLFETPVDLAPQAPLSMGLSRQEYWRQLPFPPPEDLPNPGIQPTTPARAGGFFHHWVTWEVPIVYYCILILACWKGFFFFLTSNYNFEDHWSTDLSVCLYSWCRPGMNICRKRLLASGLGDGKALTSVSYEMKSSHQKMKGEEEKVKHGDLNSGKAAHWRIRDKTKSLEYWYLCFIL